MKKLTTFVTALAFSSSLISMAHAHQSKKTNLDIKTVEMVKLSNNDLVAIKSFEEELRKIPEDIKVENESTHVEFTAEELMDIEKFEKELIKLSNNTSHTPKL